MAFVFEALPATVSIVDDKGRPNRAFTEWLRKAIEAQVTDILAVQQAAEDAQTAADTATAAAATAQTAADDAATAATNAQTSADNVETITKLVGSGVTGCTITGTDAGTDADVTISAHTRIYGDGSTLAVGGGSVTGLAYSTDYFIYYDDPTFADTTPTYAATTSETTAAQVGDRHLVGQVTTPAALDPDTDGFKVDPSGLGYINY